MKTQDESKSVLVIAPFGLSESKEVETLVVALGQDASHMRVIVPAGRPSLELELAGASVLNLSTHFSFNTLFTNLRNFWTLRKFVKVHNDLPVFWSSGGWFGPYEMMMIAAMRMLGIASYRKVDSTGRVTFIKCSISFLTFRRALTKNILGALEVRRQPKLIRRFDLPRVTSQIDRLVYARLDPEVSNMVEPGGAQSHVEGVIGGLQDLGVEVVCITASPIIAAGRSSPEFVGLEFPVEANVYKEFVPALLSRSLTDQLKEIELGRVDAVYARHSLFNIAGIELAARTNVPFILEANGVETKFRSEYDSIRFRQAARRMEREMFHHSSLVIAVSERVREDILRLAPRANVIVVPNGVDRVLFDIKPSEAMLQRRALGLGDREVLIGFFGRFYAWHGMETLSSAAPAILSARSNVHLLLVGSGPHREMVERATKSWESRVHVTGIIAHGLVPPLMQACDILVSPHSPKEGFVGSPMKIFEYLMSGGAVVASDLEQIGQVIDHGKTGLLFPPGDSEAFVEAILRLVDDWDFRRRLSHAARKDALTRHTWEKKMAFVLQIVTCK